VSGAGCQEAGKRWWASSITIQCGRPVLLRISCSGEEGGKEAGAIASGTGTEADSDMHCGSGKQLQHFVDGGARSAVRFRPGPSKPS